MAKLLKHFGLGGKKTSHRTDCNAQKSNSTQELTPKSPTRYRSSVSLSTSSHHDSFDTHSLKSYFPSGDSSSVQGHCTSNNRHDHSSSSKLHGSGCRHQGSCSKEQGSLSPRGSCSTDVTQHSFHNASVAEESDVFDESPLDGASLGELTPTSSQLPMVPPPRVLDEYCDPIDLKKNAISESSNLLGACAPNHLQPDDDYSVPYEVKKIMPDVKLRERFTANSNGKCNGSPAKSHDFDEPQEWLANLSVTSGDGMPQNSANQQTPMMTPKKTVGRSPQSSGELLVHGTKDMQQSAGRSLSGNPSLPLDVTGASTELASLSSDDISGISSPALTPTSAVTDDVLSSSELVTAETSNSEIQISSIVEENSVPKQAESDFAVVKHSVAAPTHGSVASHGERCKHSSKHHSHQCSHGKNKKAERLRHSRSDEGAETDNTGIFSYPYVKDIVPLDVPIEQQSWYHGPLGRFEAEELLRQQLQGSFLVRQSESNKLDYSLSLKSSSGFLHLKIVGQDGNYILGQFSQPFESIPRMVEFFCQAKLPLRGNEQICLMHPLVRADRD